MENIKVGIVGTCAWQDFHRYTGGQVVWDMPTALSKNILIFTGGEDINPALYHDRNKYCGRLNPERDVFEKNVLIHALAYGIKVLGICRGHQLINAVLGGSLIQDIRQETGCIHDKREHIGLKWLHNCFDDVLFRSVNSYHHQAVFVPGKHLEVLLRSHDGIVEATANEDGSIVTFQFHPEWDDLGPTYFRQVMNTGNLIW